MPRFTLNGASFTAVECKEGILINPILPKAFDDTPNEHRPPSQKKWWNRPFILTVTIDANDPDREQWLQSWPSGTRFDVRCLDGGAWDRSTVWGAYATIEEAIKRAKDNHF